MAEYDRTDNEVNWKKPMFTMNSPKFTVISPKFTIRLLEVHN